MSYSKRQASSSSSRSSTSAATTSAAASSSLSSSSSSSSSPSPTSRPTSSTSSSSASPAETTTSAIYAVPPSSRILPLDYGFSDGQLVYSAEMTLGSDTATAQTLKLLVDTGSADLWVADTNCRSDSCSSTAGRPSVIKYNPSASGATSLNTNWNVSYIGGGAAGSIYTQDMSLAGISISGQAFGSANRVDDEPLSSMNVSGILGLSVPVGSFIQTQVAGNSAGNDLDTSPSDTGSILPGLLGSITGSRRMFGLGLQRLPSDGGGRKANSSLAIRGVDPAYVPDGTPLNFNAAVISDSRGLAHHWNLYVTGITVTANGSTYPIPASFTGLRTVAPTAVIDSAAALSYAPAELLNALYGAFIDPSTNRRIGPGDNGIYYVPCTLPLNISMTVGGVTIPIHPLDASLSQATPDTSGSKAEGCIGSFQAVNAGSPAGADIVLGAPFIRSAYTVFSCDTDDSTCSPSIAFYPTTTNSSQAFEEFKQVRVQGEQLGSNSGYGFESLTGKSSGGLGAAAKIAIGIVVSIVGLLAIFGVVVWWARRRAAAAKRRARESGHDVGAEKDGSGSGAASFAREGWDSDSPDPSAAALSAKEQQRLREAALLHGYFDEDIAGTADDERGPIAGARPVGSGFGASPAAGVTPQWDVSSKGYVDARRVRREYLERHPSLIELRETSMSRMPREASQPQQQHTIADSATLHPPEDEADAEFSTIDNVIDQRRSTTSSRRNLMNPPQ